MNKCELCDSLAKIFCESDQASLCWDCDAQVHGANFLVAKHSRTLLCHVCQSLTPWNGSGRKLGPTVSVCENCVNGLNQNEARNQGNNEEDDDEDHVGDNLEEDDEDNSDDDDDDDDDDDGDGGGGGGGGGDVEDEDEEENQVVPWSFTPPPPVSCSSTSEECSNRLCNSEESPSKSKSAFLWKRMRHSSTDLCAQIKTGAYHLNSNTRTGKEQPTTRIVNAEVRVQDQKGRPRSWTIQGNN